MTNTISHSLILEKLNWSDVRPIYKKLSDEFHILTSAYNIALDHETKHRLDVLIILIDEVDFIIDNIENEEDRKSMMKSLTTFLDSEDGVWNGNQIEEKFYQKINNLRIVLNHLETKKRFIKAVKQIFVHTEEKRYEKNMERLIERVMEEGKYTAELPLSIMGVELKEDFGLFFSKLCMLMGVADLIIDARADYKTRILLYKPNLKLYLHLFGILIKNGISMIFRFPSKWNFFKYCLRFSWALATSKEKL